MNNKTLLKFLILCFVLTLSLGVQAQGYECSDFTDDFDKSKVGFKQQCEECPAECMAKLINQESFLDPVIECYDKKGVKHLLSLRKRNKLVKDSIDISKPMILHLMVDEDELPLKYYKFLTFCWMDGCQYESNIAEMTKKGKSFFSALSRCNPNTPLYFLFSPDDSPSQVYPIGPFSKER
ncbi:MAG: hypothetical protein UH850_15700 [Paludibacteraceae bacterium]|nr:hypothetical protein [Paludibacteraceae bacterium]